MWAQGQGDKKGKESTCLVHHTIVVIWLLRIALMWWYDLFCEYERNRKYNFNGDLMEVGRMGEGCFWGNSEKYDFR